MGLTRTRWDWRAFLPVIVPVVIGAVFRLTGHPLRATIVWGAAAFVLVLVLLGVPVQQLILRASARIAHWVGVVATGAVGVVLVVGGWLARLLGRSPLTPRRARGNSWQRAAPAAASRRLAAAPYAFEPGRGVESRTGSGTFLRTAFAAVGVVAALLVLDVGAGLAWEAATDGGSEQDHVVDAINMTGNTETVADVRAEHPAMAAYPWADEYLRELQLTPSSYWPFTEARPLEFRGEYVTVEGWSRRSYVPADLPDDAPVVWMFGGSTTWGEGQRDEYTIASYVARLAEEAGTPIRIVNYGQRGWTHFQEMILFEQLLAAGPPPDLAIFYDGANEITTQSLSVKGVPSHTLADQYADLISGGIADELIEVRAEPGPLELAKRAYLQHSALRKLVRGAKDYVDRPAGASPAQDDGDDEQTGRGQNYVMTVEDARNAVDVYERGRAMTGFLAESYDVDVEFFWQPVRGAEPQRWASENMSEPTIDISDSLDDHQDVYIDGGHTNEEGARIVAERIWTEIAPVVAGYED